MGGVALAFLFAGAAHSSDIDRDESRTYRRYRCRAIRCLFMEQWHRLPIHESNPSWTNVAREFSGARWRMDGSRLFNDRTQIACEDVAYAVYLFGLWNGGDVFVDHRIHRARKSIRLSLDHIHLDFVVGARAAIDWSLDL